MKFSDEVLMAYADGELGEPERAAVEQAMRGDPAIAEAVARHRQLRDDVFDAFAGVLDEPVPGRLAPSRAELIPMAQLRAARDRQPVGKRRWSWPEWGALAASVAIGVVAGAAGWHGLQGAPLATVAQADGRLVAQGRLAAALTEELAGMPRGDVRIGVSFVSQDGAYCRSFTLGANAGLACRVSDDWRIPVLAESGAPAASQYRQAGVQLPAAVLDAIDARIAGAALDARGEQAARGRGWQR